MIANKIAEILQYEKPIIINGPSILDKYVCEAERKIREIFNPIINNPNKNSVIICDGFDSLAKHRDDENPSIEITTQFLSMIDGSIKK